ncbi:unnamed protein product [Merluccius merluccius]
MGLYRGGVSRATGQVMRAAVLLLFLQEVQMRESRHTVQVPETGPRPSETGLAMGLYRGGVSRATGQVMRAAVLLLFLQEVQMRAYLGSTGANNMKGIGQPTYGAGLGLGVHQGQGGPQLAGNPMKGLGAGAGYGAQPNGGPGNGGQVAPKAGYGRVLETGNGHSGARCADQVSSTKGVSVASPDQTPESLGGFPLLDSQRKHQKMPPPLLQSNSFSPEPEPTPEPNPAEPEPAQVLNVNPAPEEPVTDVLLEATPQPAEQESGPEVPQEPKSSPESPPKEHHLVPDMGYVTGSALPEQSAPETELLPGAELTGLLAPKGVDSRAPVPETVATTTRGGGGQQVVPERAVIQHQPESPGEGEGSRVEISGKPGSTQFEAQPAGLDATAKMGGAYGVAYTDAYGGAYGGMGGLPYGGQQMGMGHQKTPTKYGIGGLPLAGQPVALGPPPVAGPYGYGGPYVVQAPGADGKSAAKYGEPESKQLGAVGVIRPVGQYETAGLTINPAALQPETAGKSYR